MTAKLCLALDVKNLDEARRLVGETEDYIDVVKVGPELVVGEGIPYDVRKPIFLDLKLHDIPETVERTIRRVGDRNPAIGGVKYMTIHAQQPDTMWRAAEVAKQYGITLLCVTVLTSMTWQDCRALGYEKEWPNDRASDLIQLALSCGVTGFVCSPEEVGVLRRGAPYLLYNEVSRKGRQLDLDTLHDRVWEECRRVASEDLFFVTPGIRPNVKSTDDLQDQKRVGSPELAVREGSNMLVVGRPIRDAACPREAAQAIREEMDRAGRDSL